MKERTEKQKVAQNEANIRYLARGRVLKRPKPPITIIREREKLEKDTALWLRQIFPGIYRQPFGKVHHAIIEGADYTIDHGGRFVAIASRGVGKSYVLAGCALKAVVQKRRRFPVIIPWASGSMKKALNFWKKALCFNREFARLYPEWAFPFVASAGTSQRCAAYTDEDGKPIGAQLLMTEGMIVMPDSMAVIAGTTLNGNPLGLQYTTDSGEGLRPDLAFIDDPQDRETAMSKTQIANTIKMIDEDIAGMSGADGIMPMMMAATKKATDDVADHYSKVWRSVCVPQIISWPSNMKLWEEWNIARQDGEHNKDKSVSALKFYKENKEALTEGFEVSWEHRYAKTAGQPDALYAAMHDYYTMGHDAFMSERQNEPVNNMETGRPYTITADIIKAKINQYDKFILPDWAGTTVAATDLNPSYALSSVVCGFGRDQTCAVGWYGLHPMDIPGDTTAPERARRIYDELAIHGRLLASIQCKPDLWIIDASGTDFDVVLRFCNDSFRLCGLNSAPATGRASKLYKPWGKNVITTREQCHMRFDIFQGRRRKWIVWNADHWREVAQRAWLGEVGSPGSCSIFNGRHGEFADQICREALMGKADVGGTMLYNWHTQPGKHDFGDCMAMCYAGSAWQGIGSQPSSRGVGRKFTRRASGVSVISM
jgi:hypothetical protein